MNDDDGALGGGMNVAFHDSGAHGKPFAKSLDRVLRHDLRPTAMGEVDRPAARSRRLGVGSLLDVSRATTAVTNVPASAPRMKEPAPSRISQMLSATMGESPCCLMIALLMLDWTFRASVGVVNVEAAAGRPTHPSGRLHSRARSDMSLLS